MPMFVKPRHADRPAERTPSPLRRRGWTRWWSLAVLAPVAAVAALAFHARDPFTDADAVDACQAGDGGRAVLLLDLRKPLGPLQSELPGEILRTVSHGLAARTELEVHALAGYAEASRMLLGRLCKPYGNDELAVATAKDRDEELRDCDDLPAQIPTALRQSARTFCREREALVRRVDALASARGRGPVENAYLLEALDDTARDLAGFDGPRSLHVLSDMMQHAKWFSHLDMPWDAWDFDQVSARRAEQAGRGTAWESGSAIETTVHYLARRGATDHPEQREAHRAFWTAYFADAPLAFDDQPGLLDYTAEPLVEVPSAALLIAQERERVRHAQAELDQARAELDQGRAELARGQEALEAGRAQLAAQRRRWEDSESALRREQELLRNQREALASERARLGALADASRDPDEAVRAGAQRLAE